MTDTYNEHYHTTVYDESRTDENEARPAHRTGKHRVVHLVLMLMLTLLIVAVLMFGVIPYVESMTQSPLPLPPAVQT